MNNDASPIELLAGGLIAGVVCGFVPLLTGIVKNRPPLGFGGFFACIAGGSILGLILALPMAGLFTSTVSPTCPTVSTYCISSFQRNESAEGRRVDGTTFSNPAGRTAERCGGPSQLAHGRDVAIGVVLATVCQAAAIAGATNQCPAVCAGIVVRPGQQGR